MGIILWIIFGAIVGYGASIIIKNNAPQHTTLEILTGITGALLGGWAMSVFGRTGGIITFNIYSAFMAMVGAGLLIALTEKLQAER